MTKPTFIAPMLATLVAAPFDDPDWLFEVKWHGFRVESVVTATRPDVDPWPAGRVGLLRAVPRSADVIACEQAVVDGE